MMYSIRWTGHTDSSWGTVGIFQSGELVEENFCFSRDVTRIGAGMKDSPVNVLTCINLRAECQYVSPLRTSNQRNSSVC